MNFDVISMRHPLTSHQHGVRGGRLCRRLLDPSSSSLASLGLLPGAISTLSLSHIRGIGGGLVPGQYDSYPLLRGLRGIGAIGVGSATTSSPSLR